ncbi:MAG: hypothetical protein EB101_01465 [Chitinophagia bacterium]|nr:hypothetical protein [Chitinophagia bacterium]
MKSFLNHLTALSVLLSVSLISLAQQPRDYKVQLRAGVFVPPANATKLRLSDQVFRTTQFGPYWYAVLQFNDIPTVLVRQQLELAGITLLDYFPNYAYAAKISTSFDISTFSAYTVRAVFGFQDIQKTIPDLLYAKVPAHAVLAPGTADVTIITFEPLNRATIEPLLLTVGAQIIREDAPFRSFVVSVPVAQLKGLVRLPVVQWAEFIDEPNQNENLPGRSLHRVSPISDGPRNLKGEGINVGIWDGGAIGQHLDFLPTGRVTQVENAALSNHSTHCSGTILGKGIANPVARGMAPNAKLYSYDFNGSVSAEIAAAIPAYNLVVSSHSYGGSATCGINGASIAYSATSRSTDLNLNNFPYHLHVHSAGNSQTSCTGGWYTITGSGKSAKNNILVANVTSTDAISSSSSFGPVQDGRVKPDISAMGTNVFSTYSTGATAYATISGTSMATPGVSGSVALLVERFKQLNNNTLPPSALIKSAVLNTAQDLGNLGPDYRFGYGRIDALEAIRVLENNRYAVNSIANAALNEITITVPSNTVRLNVMLNWNDPAGAPNANPALVNNLDLTVTNSTTNYLPWILDKDNPSATATTGVDNVSNVEQVTVYNPPAGTYQIKVAGTSVATGTNQQYAVSWTVDQPRVEIIYPNGAESFSPGSSEVITWNQLGATGTQSLEYSLDNGATWNLIANNIASSTTRFTWSVPVNLNTSQALVRITNGSLVDQSDATFKILGTVNGFSGNGTSCAAGEINFSWTAVTGATHYDIYQLNQTTGGYVLFAGSITSTNYTATGLTPGQSNWYAIRSRSTVTNAESERTNAIAVTTSSGGGNMGTPGPITGETTICGTGQVTYSISAVAGATGYVWAVPLGGAILSGQGTNQITVTFASGSQSGNVTVYATNANCQTPAVQLAVTVGNSSLAAPVSGGNQQELVCPGASVPTLTASASVPAGQTVVWYTAATSGTVVSSPTRNTIGTVTYFAAARDNATGCEGVTRTAVTLTLIAVPAASITASGPTSFCQGGSVTLSANSGTSYLWSTGQTGSSINVNTSASVSVTVTTGSCVSTSATTVVTAHPLPIASITPLTSTRVCDGDRVLLAASAGSTWSWSNGATTQSVLVGTGGNYIVTVTNNFGCSAVSAPVAVTIEPNPVATLQATPYSKVMPGLQTAINATVTPAGSYTYTWFLNNNTLLGETSGSVDSIGWKHPSGSYKLRIQNNPPRLPCANTSEVLVIGDSVTTKLFIFPSPNNGLFKVSYYSAVATTYSLQVFDTRGSMVFSKQLPATSGYPLLEVDLRAAQGGLYVVRLVSASDRVIASGRVVINH